MALKKHWQRDLQIALAIFMKNEGKEHNSVKNKMLIPKREQQNAPFSMPACALLLLLGKKPFSVDGCHTA